MNREDVLGEPPRWVIQADFRERRSALFQLILESAIFDLRVEALDAGDYILNDRVIVERKTLSDFALSVIDGRLFAQAAAIKKSPHRPVILVENCATSSMPRIDPKALKGALLSLAVSWRLPVVFSRDAADSLLCLRLLAEQRQAVKKQRAQRIVSGGNPDHQRRLFVLQGLPGVGPILAGQLLAHFGSVEKVFSATAEELGRVPGCGPKKANLIRKVLGGG